MSSITAEELLEHSDWLRQLASRLVADPATVEDLVQETWIAALRRPPEPGGSPRPWLARVLRNLDRNRRRASVRRADQELLAREESVNPTPEEIAREAEGQRIIAEAVAELGEPHRTVVVLRYFRGLDSSEIGRMRGVSSSTVRGQLRQALDELRRRLDSEHGGRSAWATFLIPLLQPLSTATKTTTGVTAMGSSFLLKIAAVLTAVVFLPYLGVRLFSGTTSSSLATPETWPAHEAGAEPAAVEAAALADTAMSSPSVEPEFAARAGTSPPRSAATNAPGAATPSPASPSFTLAANAAPEDPVLLRGQFLFPGGAPVVGMDVEIRGHRASTEREHLYGLPEAWEDPHPVTDTEGRFESSFVAPRAFSFQLSAKQPGYARDRWWWDELLPGTVVDLGTATLRRGGVVEATIVREDGTPLTGESWKVIASETSPPAAFGRLKEYLSEAVDRETGTFRLEDMPPGPLQLHANSPMSGWLDRQTVQVISDATVTTPLVYSGPDNSRRISINCRNQLMLPLGSPGRNSIELHGASGESVTATPVATVPDLYSFDDLEPGSYTLEIVDPRFVPWSEQDVLTGTMIRAALVGSCALSFQATNGEPIEPQSVRFECLEVVYTPPWLSEGEGQQVVAATWFPNRYETSQGSDYLTGTRLIGLVPGSYRVTVDAGEVGTTTLEVRDLVAGEERAVVIDPGSAEITGIAGIVREADGSPAGQVEVLLLLPAAEDDSTTSPVLGPGDRTSEAARCRQSLAKTSTDAEGEFAFDHPGAGSYALHAKRGEALSVSTEVFSLANGEAGTGRELTLPAEAILVGQLVGPTGCSTDGLLIVVAPASLPTDGFPFWKLSARATRALNADGSFRSQSLPAGPVVPYLQLPVNPLSPTGSSGRSYSLSSTGGLAGQLALEEVLLEAGMNEHEFQLLAKFPGTLEVTVSSSGAPLSGVKVRLAEAASLRESGLRHGFTDPAGGPARILDFPGARSLEISDSASGWRYRNPGSVQVPAGATSSLQIDVELATATLTALDADGAPLPGAAIQLAFPDGFRTGRVGEVRTTDGNGSLEATLVPGEYLAYLLAADASDEAAMEAARRSLYQPDPEVPEASFPWTAAGAEVGF